MLLWANWGVLLPSVLLRVLLTLFPYCLIIRLFRYGPFVAIFFSKIVLFPCHPVVVMSLCILPQLASRISFRCFRMSCLVCIIIFSLSIFLVYLLSPVPSGLFPRVVSFVLIVVLLFSVLPNLFQLSFPVLSFLLVVEFFFVCVSSLSSHPGFKILFVFFRGTPISHGID